MGSFDLFIIVHIPDQFTVKAHPALFEGEGRRMRGEPENEALLFQSTDNISVYTLVYTLYYTSIYTFKTRTEQKNCEGSDSVPV